MAEVECRSLTKRYGHVVAVDRLDLAIRDREFLVLLGPSGCGKTTTLNMIAGLEEATDGQLLFDGRDVTFVPPHRREVAMVFQSYALYPNKTVFENIAFPLRLRRHPVAEIEPAVREVAAQLEIEHLLDRRPDQLSGGQRQRVALGRAIVRKPAVFLMDEPLSNLDAGLRISMRSLIKRLHQSLGTTFVYVTHDQAEAMTLADRIVVMRGGLVQQLDSPAGIYDRPRNLFVASFLGSPPINQIPAHVQAAPDGSLRLALGGGQTLPVPTHAATLVEAGQDVVVGLRPEDVVPAPAAPPGDPRLSGVVELVSPLGSENHLEVRLAAGAVLTLRVGKTWHANVGATVAFALPPDRLHLFDARSEAALRVEAPA